MPGESALGGSGAFNFSSSFTDLNAGLFGTNQDVSRNGSSTSKATGSQSGTNIEQLDISAEGVQKILQDILGGSQGLAAIFSEDNVAGLYNSSVSKQASGDLLSKLAGEIAKLTAKKITTQDVTTEQDQKTNQQTTDRSSSPGLLSNLTGGLL